MTKKLIYLEDAIDALCNDYCGGHQDCKYYPNCENLKSIERLPSAQPERKKGDWIRNDNGTYSCSVCQSWIPEQQHCYARYCLYCGADMRGEPK